MREKKPPKARPNPRYNPLDPGNPRKLKERPNRKALDQDQRSKRCIALGCNNSKVSHYKFFQFPKNETIRDIWIRFSRRGNEYDVKKNAFLCEEHFDPSCFLHKEKKTFLVKNSIPSIFIRQTPDGSEKTVLTFDQSVLHYVEEDTFLKPVDHHEKLQKKNAEKCQRKLKEIREEVCRFCFAADCEKLVQLRNLIDYGVNINEMLVFIGINNQQNNIFSELACEECFQELVGFDGYRKRCQKAQRDIMAEIKNLKEKIAVFGGEIYTAERTAGNHLKIENVWSNDAFDDLTDFPVKVIVEENFFESSQVKEQNFQQIIIKEEAKDELLSDSEFGNNGIDSDDDDSVDLHSTTNLALKEEEESFIKTRGKEKKVKTKDEAPIFQEAVQTDDSTVVISQRQAIANALYECFTCQKRFAGRKTFDAHDCPVQLTCPFPDCGLTFKKMGGYVSHIMKMHNLPQVQRKFCKVCKFSWTVSDEDFTDHQKKCLKDDESAVDRTIECQKCGKICKNIKAYTVHQMFHEQDPNYPKTREEKLKETEGIFICETCGQEMKSKKHLNTHILQKHTVVETNPDGTEKTVCEICGKEFINSFQLKKHKQNIHDIGRKKPKPQGPFYCDICGQIRLNKLAIYDHIRRSHIDDPSPCLICGRVFRVPQLLKTHMKYHSAPKHRCQMCPEKAYATSSALRRHQESNHGMGPGYPCDFCSAVYKTRPTLSTHRWDVHQVKGRYNERNK